MGAVTVGAVDPKLTDEALYWNPTSAWSPLSTAGKMIVAVAVLPAASRTVIVAVAVATSAASGVPPITPVPVLRVNPDGRSVALYSSMSTPPLGLMDVIASPTFRDTGAL